MLTKLRPSSFRSSRRRRNVSRGRWGARIWGGGRAMSDAEGTTLRVPPPAGGEEARTVARALAEGATPAGGYDIEHAVAGGARPRRGGARPGGSLGRARRPRPPRAVTTSITRSRWPTSRGWWERSWVLARAR